MGRSKEDGYGLIKQIRQIPELQHVPIVVCSKMINDSDAGMAEAKRAEDTDGVVAAYAKAPHYPTAAMFLKHAKPC